MAELTNSEYYVYEQEDCDTLVDEEDGMWVLDESYTSRKVEVNKSHYFKGYYFWNDMDDYEDKDEHCAFCVNTLKDWFAFMEANSGGGHFQCTYIEDWVDGELVNTVQVSDEEGWTEEGIQLSLDNT